jgi:hypothetical protein
MEVAQELEMQVSYIELKENMSRRLGLMLIQRQKGGYGVHIKCFLSFCK